MCMSSDRGEQAESDTGGQLIDDDFAAACRGFYRWTSPTRQPDRPAARRERQRYLLVQSLARATSPTDLQQRQHDDVGSPSPQPSEERAARDAAVDPHAAPHETPLSIRMRRAIDRRIPTFTSRAVEPNMSAPSPIPRARTLPLPASTTPNPFLPVRDAAEHEAEYGELACTHAWRQGPESSGDSTSSTASAATTPRSAAPTAKHSSLVEHVSYLVDRALPRTPRANAGTLVWNECNQHSDAKAVSRSSSSSSSSSSSGALPRKFTHVRPPRHVALLLKSSLASAALAPLHDATELE